MEASQNTIGLIVIGTILLVIVGAFIFSEKFRKDVIASQGEASILGMFNVKGVIIILLAAIFCGAFIYILQMGNGKQGSALTDVSIESYTESDKSTKKVMLNKDSLLYTINSLMEIDYYENSSIELGKWNNIVDVNYEPGEAFLCFRVDSIISLSNQNSIQTQKKNVLTSGLVIPEAPTTTLEGTAMTIRTGSQTPSIGEREFSKTGTSRKEDSKYLYVISFGERRNKTETVHEYKETIDIYGSSDYSIDGQFFALENKGWIKNYRIQMRIGNLSSQSTNFRFGDKVKPNINAVIIGNEMKVIRH